MAMRSNTNRTETCIHCKRLIELNEYITWDRRGQSGARWHMDCDQPRLDPDVHGFPSRKDGRCVSCHRDIRRGQRIVSVNGTFRHLDCAALPTPAPTPPTNEAPTPTPTPTPATETDNDLGQLVTELSSFIARTGTAMTALETRLGQTDASVADLATAMAAIQTSIANLQERQPIQVVLCDQDGNQTTRDMGIQHRAFPLLLKYLMTRDPEGGRINVYLRGPAGTGKSTAARIVAETLGLDFWPQGKVADEFTLLGYERVFNGQRQPTAFTIAFEHGGVFLADEMDRWNPAAILALNGALANHIIVLPGGEIVRQHKDFVCIAAGNTSGRGNDANYVATYKLDATSLDRFIGMAWDYDPEHERHIVGHTGDVHLDAQTDEWVSLIQQARQRATDAGAINGITISMRASIYGASMLRTQTFTRDEILSGVFKDLRDPKVCPAWSTIGADLEAWASRI